ARRMSDAARITVSGGTVSLTAGAGPYTEDIGTLALRGGGTGHINVNVPLGAANGTIRWNGFDFQGRGAGTLAFSIDNGGAVQFTSPPALSNGIIGPYASINGADWASIDSAGRVWPLPGYWNDSNPATWDASKNVGLFV